MRRFALIHYQSDYYQRMMQAFAAALRAEGAEAACLSTSIEPNRAELDQALQCLKPTDTLSVNWPRGTLPISDGCMHHVWLQDRHWPNQDQIVDTPAQRVWYWVRRWGRTDRWLPPATDWLPPAKLPVAPRFDVGFIGFVPVALPPDIDGAFSRVMLRAVADRNFTSDPEVIRAWAGGTLDPGTSERIAAYGMRRYQRHSALRRLCDDGRFRVAIWGPYSPPEFKSWHHGELTTDAALQAAYADCAVTLHLNGDTYMHTRVLESLALGVSVLAEHVHGADAELSEFGGAMRVFRGLGAMVETLADMLGNLERERTRAAHANVGHRWRDRAREILAI